MKIKQDKHNKNMKTEYNQICAYDSNKVTPQQSSTKNFHCRGELGFSTNLMRKLIKVLTTKMAYMQLIYYTLEQNMHSWTGPIPAIKTGVRTELMTQHNNPNRVEEEEG